MSTSLNDYLEERGILVDPRGFAYRKGEIVVRDAPGGTGLGSPAAELPGVSLYRGIDDPVTAVRRLRASGVEAAVNHVFFGEPVYLGNPVYAGNPVYLGNPVYAGNPFVANGARPAAPLELEPREECERRPTVLVLDTGLATRPVGVSPEHPALAGHAALHAGWTSQASGGDASRWDEDERNLDTEGSLDRQAGHGTFIAGIVRRLAPHAVVASQGVLSSFGDGDDFDIAAGLFEGLTATPDVDIVNLSLGGYTDDDRPPPALATAVDAARARGLVVVAAAGNAASCRPFWPAALPGVVAVGALDCSRPAWFTNHGPWVDACAPGVDVVSTFYVDADGPASELGGLDPDAFAGWASWSGTSFAAPKVAAAIAREMCRVGVTAAAAEHTLLRRPGLFRLPDLGVVVNLA